MKPRLVKVDWEDTTSHSGWSDKDEAKALQCLQCSTVGYIVSKKGSRLVLAATLEHKHSMRSDQCVIPKGCIRKITHLREV